jgi:hypothetical protein
MISFAQVEKAIGGGFATISNNSKHVEGELKSLNMKY